jgi:hypothetical protein
MDRNPDGSHPVAFDEIAGGEKKESQTKIKVLSVCNPNEKAS